VCEELGYFVEYDPGCWLALEEKFVPFTNGLIYTYKKYDLSGPAAWSHDKCHD